jgi:acetyl-CoA carboxylase biotin carboxyl carrier protein
MNLSVEEIREILRLVDESGCEEFRLETGDLKLVVRKSAGAGPTAPPAPAPASVPAPAPLAAPRTEAARPTAPAAGAAVPAGLHGVRAPMTGTFYRAPAPGAPPFVEVGADVKEQDTVGILEVMKLMNSLEAGVRGRVVRICAENAALVSQGDVLVLIDPEAA